jgi:alpha-ketoglutarate-dependent taurine dioxygenase
MARSPKFVPLLLLGVFAIGGISYITFKRLRKRNKVKCITIPEQKTFDEKVFPLVYSPTAPTIGLGESINWVANNLEEIDRNLLEHSVILFRGFSINTPESFNAFVEAFNFDNLPYVGGAAVRRQLAPRVFTANESPPSEVIPFHHEMAQAIKYPTKLFFCCTVPPDEGGETPMLLSHLIVQRLQQLYPEFIQKMESLGLRYIRVMPEEDDPTSAIGRSWKSTYQVKTREEAEKKMNEIGTEFKWNDDGSLYTKSAVVRGILQDHGKHRSGKKVFFNSSVAAYFGWQDSRNDHEKAVVFGDDSPIDPRMLQEASRIMDEICVAVPWQKGDVFLVDNLTAMHARRPFKGPRQILASLAVHDSR